MATRQDGKSASKKTKQVMDVSRPSQTKAGATSKPVITGHKPLIGDPMVRDDVPVSELTAADSRKSIEINAEPKATPPEEPEEPKVETEAAEQPPKSSAKSANSRFKPSDELVEQVAKSKAGGDAAPEEAQEEPEDKPEKKPADSAQGEKLDSQAPVDAVLGDAKGVKEAELEQVQQNEIAQSLIESGKYKVKISASARHHGSRLKSTLLFALAMLLLVGVLLYLAVDSGFIRSSIKLPFHIFKQTEQAAVSAPVTVVTDTPATKTPAGTSSSTPIKIPAGFTAYKMVDANISFAYPTAWGNVLVTPEKGYTKRDASQSSDGVFSYKAGFSKNADTELVMTSDKYLPAARGRMYYDYLKWCVNASSGKFYNSLLTYKTAGNVDTADQVVCDQGPLSDAIKLDDSTLQQLKVKDAMSQAVIGDLYSKNLTTTGDLVVLHAKDATSLNADNIIKLLATVVVGSN